MTTILLYLLIQFNISTSDSSEDTKTQVGEPTEYVQNDDGGRGGWGDGG